MENVISYRIKNARKMKLLSQQELADEIGVSKQMISKYEKGESIPDSSKLIRLAAVFEQKVDYFFKSFSVDIGEVSFRKKAKFSKKKEASLKEMIKVKLENYLWLEERLSINATFKNVLEKGKINSPKDVEIAVLKIRKHWEIGLDPVHNIIQLLEDKEIKVIELNDIEDNFDGLACFVNDKYPVIVINGNFSVERKRFTLLHELGHLLLNLNDCEEGDEEMYCNKFASEFLLPLEIVAQDFGGKRSHVSLSEFIAAQKKYGISIPAIVYRLVDAEVFSKEQQKIFYQKINSSPKLKEEVNQTRFETPERSTRFERLVYRALSEEQISISKASALLNEHIDLVQKNLEAL